jgi:hypothetical protein
MSTTLTKSQPAAQPPPLIITPAAGALLEEALAAYDHCAGHSMVVPDAVLHLSQCIQYALDRRDMRTIEFLSFLFAKVADEYIHHKSTSPVCTAFVALVVEILLYCVRNEMAIPAPMVGMYPIIEYALSEEGRGYIEQAHEHLGMVAQGCVLGEPVWKETKH